jgi:CRP-like cAMP-binding protein
MASEPREVWGDLATAAFVEAHLLFRHLDDEARRDLLKLATTQTFSPSEAILRQGEAGEDFFLVLDGLADATAEQAGRTVELGPLERGAFLGEFRLLDGGPHLATVTARTEVTVVRFPSSVVAAMADRFPRVQELLESVKARRAKENAARLASGAR